MAQIFPHGFFIDDIYFKNDRDEARLWIRRKFIAFRKKVVEKPKQRLHMIFTDFLGFFSKDDQIFNDWLKIIYVSLPIGVLIFDGVLKTADRVHYLAGKRTALSDYGTMRFYYRVNSLNLTSVHIFKYKFIILQLIMAYKHRKCQKLIEQRQLFFLFG